jgi:chemotaxis methyl-accepting protein methylase
MLERTHDSDEWEAFTNALTTNLTSFFREAHHFPSWPSTSRPEGAGHHLVLGGFHRRRAIPSP